MTQRLLFLCTGNSARSQMAEAWLRHLDSGEYEVFSAGLEPKGLHPLTVRVMQEVGIDMSSHSSKSLEELLGRIDPDLFDVVVTVCDRARESCPLFPRKVESLHWSFRDPAGSPELPQDQQLALFREVRDEIRARVSEWLTLA